MGKRLIIILFVVGVVGAGITLVIKSDENNTGFNVGDRVAIKGFRSCDCVINQIHYGHITVFCDGHNGVTEHSVNMNLIEICNGDASY